jgi:hypothetical protein
VHFSKCRGPDLSLSSLENHLDLVEQQFNEVSVALIHGNTADLEQCSSRLQQCSVEFFQILNVSGRQALSNPALAQRVKAIGESMPSLRETLYRRSAFVEQALQLVVPREKESTYAADPSQSAHGTYGSAGYGHGPRQSGAFKVVAA